MRGAKLTTAAIALSLGSAYMAAAEEGIAPVRVQNFYTYPQMTDPIPATRECAVKVIKDYLGQDIVIVSKEDRVSGFRDEENLKEDITAVFAGAAIVQLSLNVTQQADGYVFPYSLLASVDYNGSGLIDTSYYPQSKLPNPADLLAELDRKMRLC